MPLTYEGLNAFTTQYIVPKTTDVIFKNDPLFIRLMAQNKMNFEGGLNIQRPIIFGELAAGFFTRGDQFDTGYRNTDTAFSVNMKFGYVNVTLLGTDDVLNRGPEAAFSLVESKMANASLTMGKLLGTKIYQDGQGKLSSTKDLDGLIAWIDDGNTNATYTGATDITASFPTVGGITRADIVPGPSTGAVTSYAQVNGINSYTNRAVSTFTLNDLNTAYGFAWFGTDQPDLIVCTQGAYNKIWQATQPNQRYMRQDSDLAKVGIKSFQFNGADVTISKYMQDVVGNTNGMILALNTNYMEMYVSANKKFQFGFTGFKEAQNTIDVSGQSLFAGNLVVSNPRSCAKLIGTGLV
jgi:hypothetical protein